MSTNRLASPPVVLRWSTVIRLRWLAGVVVFAAVVGTAAAVLLLARPVYRAEARLRLGEPPPMTGVSPAVGFFSLFRTGGDPFSNDLELLSSRTVAEDVVERAALHVKIDAPRGWFRAPLFGSLTADRDTRRATFSIEWDGDSAVQVRRTFPADSAVARVRAGTPVTFGGVRAVFNPASPGHPRSIVIDTDSFPRAVRINRPRLVVKRSRRDANVVDIRFDHTDPLVAREAVAAAVQQFLHLRAAIQRRESRETVDSLRRVAAEVQAELVRAEQAREELQRRFRLVAPEAQQEALVTRYGEMTAELDRVRGELSVLNHVLRRAGDSTGSAERWADLLAYPRFLENGTLGNVLNQMVARVQQRTELATRRREDNRDLQVLDAQIHSLDSTLNALVFGYQSSLDRREADLSVLVDSMNATLAASPRHILELTRAERQVTLLGGIALSTEQRLRQEELREALTFANIQIVDPPAIRDRPVWPRRGTGLAVAVLIGGVFGVLAMIIQQRADRSVRTAREIQAALGAPVLLAVQRKRPDDILAVPDDIVAALHRVLPAGVAARPLALLAARGDGPAREVAGALVTDGAIRVQDPAPANGAPALLVTSTIDRFSTAAVAASSGAPVIVVVLAGRTTRDDLDRTAEYLSQAGAPVAGAIAVYARAADGRDLWR